LELQSLQEKSDHALTTLRSEKDSLHLKATQLEFEIEQVRRTHEIELDDIQRKHRYQIDDLLEQHRRDIDRLQRAASEDEESARKELREEMDILRRQFDEELRVLQKRLEQELHDEQDRRRREVDDLRKQRDEQIEHIATSIGKKEREADDIRQELSQKLAEIEREKTLRVKLEAKLEQKTEECLKLEDFNRDLKGKINFLESDNQHQSQAFTTLHQEAKAAIAEKDEILKKLRAEETLRRKLHNEIQELKGNIRVFCRVRPVLADEVDAAKIAFPDEDLDGREVVVTGPDQKSSLGKDITKRHPFAFDRVFGPRWNNSEIFDEVSQLVQSALDGYNCCIFSYGQTGTGKTYLMSSKDGMIPLAVDQIYQRTKELEERGWSYTMHGSFVEVYNENLNDLLGRASDIDNKKLKIHHDEKLLKTTISDVSIVALDSPEAVHNVLSQADKYRSVAATKANMRSSRSHSVFILSLVGDNPVTGEHCEGTLNLVDLAGSERLAHSKAEGDRLKETQNINRSLSSLGDVIGALGKGDTKAHIPYSNSTVSVEYIL
jgi:kinesin family member C1